MDRYEPLFGVMAQMRLRHRPNRCLELAHRHVVLVFGKVRRAGAPRFLGVGLYMQFDHVRIQYAAGLARPKRLGLEFFTSRLKREATARLTLMLGFIPFYLSKASALGELNLFHTLHTSSTFTGTRKPAPNPVKIRLCPAIRRSLPFLRSTIGGVVMPVNMRSRMALGSRLWPIILCTSLCVGKLFMLMVV